MKLLLTILLTVLIANALAIVGLLSYSAATGRLDSDARRQYLATWRGEKLVPPPPETQQEAEAETPQQAADRIAAATIHREVLTREIQRDIELARAMKTTITEARDKLSRDVEELEQARLAFATRLENYNAQVASEGFDKALKSYTAMKPKLAKDDLMAMDDERAVRFLAAMKPDAVTAILEKCTTPDEQAKRLRLLQMLEESRRLSANQ